MQLKGAAREDVIRTIKGGNCALSLTEIDEAVMREDLLDPNNQVDLLAPLR